MTDETRTGGDGGDRMRGGAGVDNLSGAGGVDVILGGSGNDIIDGGDGDDWIRGGTGDDAIEGGEGDDVILGDAGNDTVDGGAGDDLIIDGGGDDELTGGDGADTFAFLPGHGNDTITDFDTANDEIDLSQFTMAITFTQLQGKMSTVMDPSDVTVVTGVEIDLTDFGGGKITLEGLTATSDLTAEMFCLPDCDSTVDDILVEAPVMGDENPNFYIGDTGGVTYHTAGGDDIVYAEEGDDTIYGGAGDDRLFGGEGSDTVDGGAGDDAIEGNEGDDTLTGGTGDDTLTGGGGADTFVFNSGDGKDTITDFTDGTDAIDLSAISLITGFSDLTITQDGDDTKIDLSSHGGGEIILEDFTSTDLDATDFDF